MFTRRQAIGLYAACPALAFAQADFTVGVSVVNMVAAVRDKSGRFIADLNENDFRLEENGRLQKLTYFSRQNELPLVLGLLVDTSGSQMSVLDEERDASIAFFNDVVRERTDHVFLANFDAGLQLFQNMTTSRATLEASMEELVSRVNRRPPSPGTLLYEAVLRAGDVVMSRLQGRKAVIILTDGVDTASRHSLDQAIEASVKADMIIYSICISAEDSYGGGGGFGGGSDGRGVLRKLSQKTGGAFFEVKKGTTLENIFQSIQDELRSQYSLGYVPPNGKPGFRKVRISVKRAGLTIHTREGYYAK